MAKKKKELIARLLVVDQGHILLTRKVGHDYTYLPGGHIERDEGAHAALRREMEEEFHGVPLITGFLGVVESIFDHGDKHHHEVNLIFRGQLRDHYFPRAPQSLEPDLEFLWQPIDQLNEVNLLPRPMRVLAAQAQPLVSPAFWASTIEPIEEET